MKLHARHRRGRHWNSTIVLLAVFLLGASCNQKQTTPEPGVKAPTASPAPVVVPAPEMPAKTQKLAQAETSPDESQEVIPPSPEIVPAPKPPVLTPQIPKLAEPPVLTVLLPGTKMVYSYAGRLENSDEFRFAKGFMTCQWKQGKPVEGLITLNIECSDLLDRASMSSMPPIWDVERTYAWSPDGLREVLAVHESPGAPVAPVSPVEWQFNKPLTTLNGSPIAAWCYETPDTEEEQGDDGGERRCLSPRLGVVLWQPWVTAGWVEEEDFRLIEAIPTGRKADTEGRVRSESQARELLATWLVAQNSGDRETYNALYAMDFKGIKRTDRSMNEYTLTGWLQDRGKMFKRPMKVLAKEVELHAEPNRTTLLFYQHWSSGKYKDYGPKLMVVATDGTPRILYEELFWAKRK